MNSVLTITIIFASITAVRGKPNAILEYDHPRYAFNYAVDDPLTKDSKAQWEERDGDQVKGGYSLVEPDGNVRVVEYSANDLTGFNAIVKRVGYNQHPTELQKPLPLAIPSIENDKPDYFSYGFGAVPLPAEVPKITLSGTSLPWDTHTGSYGGWVPYDNGPYATIIRKKYINGQIHTLIIGPISLAGQSIVIRKHKLSRD